MARMYATAAKVKQLHLFTRLTKEFRSDIAWLVGNAGMVLVCSATSSLLPTHLLFIVQTQSSHQ